MNHCYYCGKAVDRRPNTGVAMVCDTCKRKWRVTIEEKGKQEQQKQDIKNYWIAEKKANV